jgi:hypothetical protein
MVIKDLYRAMDNMEDNELKLIVGGISGTLINSITDAFEFILDLGRKVGSAIRRARDGNKC